MPSAISEMLTGLGQVSENLAQSLYYLRTGQIKWSHVLVQAAQIGVDALPIAVIINLISGSVLALNAADKFAMTGAQSYVGALVALASVREMAPMFTALAVGARSGTAISAEIANMAVTQQLDALRMMQVNPIRYLMAPRVIACVLTMPLITLITEFFSILGGMLTAKHAIGLHYSLFMDAIWLNLKVYDIEVSLVKALVFGLLVAGISITTGLNTTGGARNVGHATTQSTMWIAISVLIADFFMTWMFFGTRFSN